MKKLIRRVFSFLLSCRPIKTPPPVYAQVATLAPSELLKGRTALITGGTSGIGFAIALSMLKAGATVIITSRSNERLNEAKHRLSEQTGTSAKRINTLCFDMRDITSFKRKFEDALALCDKIDILVNNAGVAKGVFGKCEEDEYDTVLETNLKGPFFLSQLVARYMVDNGICGNILNVASSSSLRPGNSPYILSKWGVRSLTLGMAKALTRHGVIVNAIAPGPTATPMLHREATGDIRCGTVPAGRFALPSEIGDMAVILTSDLGRTIVGDVIYMTCGAGILSYEDVRYDF